MGAFFLYDPQKPIDVSAAKVVFREKGFDQPYEFKLNGLRLLLYKKQLIEENNWVSDGIYSLFVIGTIVYKGNSYSDTKLQLFEDLKSGLLKSDCLIGNYCLIFFNGQDVLLIDDSMDTQQLFTNKDKSFITSSFLAAAMAIDGKLTLDRPACIEKLITGYIIGKNTLFNEVIHLSREKQSEFSGAWHFFQWPGMSVPSADGLNIKDSAANQVTLLLSYMSNLKSLAQKFPAEIGLSGGYDSRLLMAAALKAWPMKISVHTHLTEGVPKHRVEKNIAEEISSSKGCRLRVIPTKQLDKYDEREIEEMLRDNLFYFDGRCSYNMGAFSPVYTRKYKTEVLRENRLTLNGLGGEIYRNYYLVSRKSINTSQWIMNHVFPVGVASIIDKQGLDLLKNILIKKYELILGHPWGKRIPNFETRRFYSEIYLPNSDALNCNAHNQLEFFVTPFMERQFVEAAYAGRAHIGIGGEYQAEMIRQIDSQIASFPLHYGFSISGHEPLQRKLYELIRGYVPDRIWNFRTARIMRREGDSNSYVQYFRRTYEKCRYLKSAADNVERLFPEINFKNLRKDNAMMPNSSFISILLYEFRDKIVF